jgi:hypothetical protein
MAMADLIAGLYLSLFMTADARCSSMWSIAGMTDAILGVPPREKNRVASLKIYNDHRFVSKKRANARANAHL